MTKTHLQNIIGSLSKTTKIPVPGYSISAFDCVTGSKLAEVEGSVCSKCYAKKGNNRFPKIQASYRKRLAQITKPEWVKYMSELIDKQDTINKKQGKPHGYFRWFNSGDLQSLQHLAKIVEIAKHLPHIKFWLPTHEIGMVGKYLKIEPFPKNLTVRLSAAMIDQKAPNILGLTGSGVVTDKKRSNCKAYKSKNKKANCGSCRMCWNPNVKEIYYPLH